MKNERLGVTRAITLKSELLVLDEHINDLDVVTTEP
ncbi:hypothetical protein CWE34_06410 [Bacillus sp. SN10]|nr:hypothetical protein CWE34_06410 [Bacillus sp. SN10]